jgi:hypothetical protein
MPRKRYDPPPEKMTWKHRQTLAERGYTDLLSNGDTGF